VPRGFRLAEPFEAARGISDETLGSLADRGHLVARADVPFGGGQVIVIDQDRPLFGAGSDPRKDGIALAF
jgi:gamma-glutamyltranspeptidase / glutathione hydrolase